MVVNLTFYGGINEIGGNKILLEDGDRRLLLDFGFPYKRHKLFYEEYLKPRSGAGLIDPLQMNLLPPLNGIYRDDLSMHVPWQEFINLPLYREINKIDGILLSHAHFDHSGYIAFLKEDIPVFSTAATALITKAIQDCGSYGFDQEVNYFSPKIKACPTDWKQEACISEGAKRQRQFCIADLEISKLSNELKNFWLQGFWERTAKQKEIESKELIDHKKCIFNLQCFPVDHSIPGASAWAIETSSGWIVYSGDLRLHGKRAASTRAFIEKAASLHPKALLIEGTNVKRKDNVSEAEVYENGLKAISKAKGLVIADFPARDIDRLMTFLQIARDTHRKLAILPKDAYLLKTMRLVESTLPDICSEPNLVIYQEMTGTKSPAIWLRNLCKEYDSKIVLAEDVRSSQEGYILCFSFYDINELPSIYPGKDSIYVFSSSEPHDEEQEIDFRRLHNWLQHFGIRGIGLPTENNGLWEIPENERGLHASGHACGPDLIEIVKSINPELVIPLHSEYPQFYMEQLSNNKMKIIMPDLGITVQI